MQVPAPFEYKRATSVDDAISLLERLGSTARLVAGGHSLLPMMKLRLADLEYLIDINDLHDELGYIRPTAAQVHIGAMTRHRELLESDELAAIFPIFADAERVIADPVVRNRGTIGGSLCQADPSEDLSAVCTTLDASCVIRGGGGERVVTMDEFYRGPTRPRSRTARCSSRSGYPCARTVPAPTPRSSGGPATRPSCPPARRSGLSTAPLRTPASGWPRSARTRPGSRRSPRHCAAGRRPRSCTTRPGRSPRGAAARRRTVVAASSTNGTSQTS